MLFKKKSRKKSISINLVPQISIPILAGLLNEARTYFIILLKIRQKH